MVFVIQLRTVYLSTIKAKPRRKQAAKLDIILLIVGITGLWIGTELTIGGALTIAKRHHLSDFFVGLVILSFGSDLPEVAIAIDAGIKTSLGQDASGIVVGSSIGSIVGQIGFVLGLTGLIAYLTLPLRFIFQHGAVLLGATVLLFLVALDGIVTRTEGLILITLYLIYVFVLLKGEKVPAGAQESMARGRFNPWVLLILGLGTLIASSELTVTSVVSLAKNFEVSEAVISVVVIGFGTSLPELSISISAILKKKIHLSVGNIIGSNILDTLLPIGIAALISPLVFEREFLLFDLPFIFILTFLTLVFFVRIRGLQKVEAGIILGLYFFYLTIKLHQL
jgi:cation:H+ antiporter